MQKELQPLCEAWMLLAGGETSAERSGITRMMFLAVFLCTVQNPVPGQGLPAISQRLDHSAVNRQIGAVDVACRGAGKKGDGIGNLGRIGKPPQWDSVLHGLDDGFDTFIHCCCSRPDDGSQAVRVGRTG